MYATTSLLEPTTKIRSWVCLQTQTLICLFRLPLEEPIPYGDRYCVKERKSFSWYDYRGRQGRPSLSSLRKNYADVYEGDSPIRTHIKTLRCLSDEMFTCLTTSVWKCSPDFTALSATYPTRSLPSHEHICLFLEIWSSRKDTLSLSVVCQRNLVVSWTMPMKEWFPRYEYRGTRETQACEQLHNCTLTCPKVNVTSSLLL